MSLFAKLLTRVGRLGKSRVDRINLVTLFLPTGSRVDLKIRPSKESLFYVTSFMLIDDVTPFRFIEDFELIHPVLNKQLISKRVRF